MSNMFEKFFEAASSRIPDWDIEYENLPKPDFSIIDDDLYITDFNDNYAELISMQDYLNGNNQSLSSLEAEDRYLIDGAIRKHGLEILAFYKSRRDIDSDPYKGKWGIFYIEQGLIRVKEQIEEYYPALLTSYGKNLRSLNKAYDFIHAHEVFHFIFDLYALSTESKMNKALYVPLRRSFRKHSIYQVEEALANKKAWEWAKSIEGGISEFAYDFMKLQPGAYARFDEDKFSLGGELAANLIDLNISKGAFRPDQALWVDIVPKNLLRKTLLPEYIVKPFNLSGWFKPAWRLPTVASIKETASFEKSISPYSSMRARWDSTKSKLISYPGTPGLNFKLWDKKIGNWSVRVNDNFRVHLRQSAESKVVWNAEEFGSHKQMGHG
jgi:hypothetical protein